MNPPLSLLITGAAGQLGRDLAVAAARAGISRIHTPGSAELDVTDPVMVSEAVASAGSGVPLVVINAAAYAAEGAGAARAQAVNAVGPAHLARACAAHRAHLIQVSTDYVFAGEGAGPHQAGGGAGGAVHGRFRGLARVRGAYRVALWRAWGQLCAPPWRARAREGGRVRVVNDQHGNPTWTVDLAEGLIALALAADRVPTGVLHCVNASATTWFGLARAVFAEIGADPERVVPCRTAELARPAPRACWSADPPDRPKPVEVSMTR